MRLISRLAWVVFLLLWVGTVVLWVRSYWRTCDIFHIYRGDGSEHLRIRRGMLALIHSDPTPPKNRQGIERVSLVTIRDESQRGGIVLPQRYPTHKQWLSFSFDGISARDIVTMQAANVFYSNQASVSALQATQVARNQLIQATINS